MAKVILDWKSPSDKKMADFVKTLTDEEKKSFAKACSEKKNGKNTINTTKAKKWLAEKFDGTDDIEWTNRPTGARRISAANEVASWLEL